MRAARRQTDGWLRARLIIRREEGNDLFSPTFGNQEKRKKKLW
jgi:hypothetical protein